MRDEMGTGSGNVKPLVGDLFESEAQTLVNTVNTVGVMGKGIALEFRRRFPEMHREYVRLCDEGKVQLGRPYLWATILPPWVLNFPTKKHWRSPARLTDIIAGLRYLELHYREWGIKSLAVPPLGCGQGGLEWRVVGPTLYQHLLRLEIPVDLYAPFETPAEELGHEFLSQPIAVAAGASLKLSPAAVALADIVARVRSERHHYPVGRIGFQKLAYFATEAGIPTGLQFVQSSYGPFAPDVKRMQSRLQNNGVLVEQENGSMLMSVPGPTLEAARQAYSGWLTQWDIQMDRVADLLLRMDGRQAEVAATIHFASKKLAAQSGHRPSELDVLTFVRQWKQRRNPPIKEHEYGSAIRYLNALGWLDIEHSPDLPMPDHERELAPV